MSSQHTTPDPDAGPNVAALGALSGRDVKSLTECMSVLPETGDARGAPGLYLVVSQTGNEYIVDLGGADPRCECRDHEYRRVECKHIRRVAYATGRTLLPDGIDASAVDPLLGEHCDGPGGDR